MLYNNNSIPIQWSSDISNVISLLELFIVLCTAAIIVWQLFEMRRTTQAQAFGVARDILQDESVRKSRKRIFQLHDENLPFNEWTETDIEDAEIVCHTYDAVGQMVRYKILWKDSIIASWGLSIQRSWPIVSPLVNQYRKQWDAQEVWDDYEWIYNETNKSRVNN